MPHWALSVVICSNDDYTELDLSVSLSVGDDLDIDQGIR